MPWPGSEPTPTRAPRRESTERLAGPVTLNVEAPPVARDIRDAVVVKEGDLFLITALDGNVPHVNPNGFGLYLGDTRYLSTYEIEVAGLHPTILLSTSHAHFLAEQILTNPSLHLADGTEIHEQTLELRRYRRLVGLGASESLTFDNFNPFPVAVEIALRVDADFADMFDVRGLLGSRDRGERHTPTCEHGSLLFRYDGRDGITRETRVSFDPAPTRLECTRATYALEVPARGSARVSVRVEVVPDADAPARRRRPAPRIREVRLRASDGILEGVFRQARGDVRALMSGADEPVLDAGIPWYSSLFGRDSIIAAMQDLWVEPDLARNTLRVLARLQGTRDDPWRDEEPGKILHELRRGEVARLGLVPFAPYYGTADATPLWIVLLEACHRATADLALVRELRPNLEAALAWMEHFGDRDGDLFIEYEKRSASGLAHQGWKDSWDGIVHADGSFPEGPLALVEVQGYAYAALLAAARLFRALGDPTRADRLEHRARRLARAFDEAFWMEDEGFYALALDGRKQQVRAISSNPGHALYSGIVPEEKAARVARRLVAEDLFSGWGIRTLSARAARYNPAGYHLGSVWPHDNAICALGLKRYGEEALALEVAEAVLAAAAQFPSYRLPELFCGFARSAFGVPVRYPVACSPQAWAATAPSALLQAMLGLELDAPARELRIARPRLPESLNWLRLEGLRVGGAEVDLRYERVADHTAVDVAAMRGDVRVTFVDRWLC